MKRTIVVLIAVVLVALPLAAQSGRQRLMMPSPVGGMNAMALEIAPDGTVITTRTTTDSMMNTSQEVVAISPAGSVVWSWKADQPISYLTIAGNSALAVTSSVDYSNGAMTSKSTITALATSNGTKLWQTSIDGMLMKLDSSSSVIYALTTKGMMAFGAPNNMMGGPAGYLDRRTLYAISASSGAVLWTVALSPTS